MQQLYDFASCVWSNSYCSRQHEHTLSFVLLCMQASLLLKFQPALKKHIDWTLFKQMLQVVLLEIYVEIAENFSHWHIHPKIMKTCGITAENNFLCNTNSCHYLRVEENCCLGEISLLLILYVLCKRSPSFPFHPTKILKNSGFYDNHS